MELQKIDRDFTVCKVDDVGQLDFSREFVFVSKTDDEISLVCESAYAPQNAVESEPGWKALKISGILDFGMVGVISNIAGILAKAEIPIFVVSTYNTDYIFLKNAFFSKAINVLVAHGYVVK